MSARPNQASARSTGNAISRAITVIGVVISAFGLLFGLLFAGAFIAGAVIGIAELSPFAEAALVLVGLGLLAVGIRILVLPRMPRLQRLQLERLMVAILPGVIFVAVAADAIWRNPTEAAALGTVSAIGYVAYQSWHTRRAADAAVRGLVTAEHALRVSQAMAAEAEKRRLDLRAPTVRVSVGDPDWPPTRPRLLANPEQKSSSPYVPEAKLEAGHIYRLPKSLNDLIGVWVEGQVSNEGSTTVEVELRGLRVYDPPALAGGRDVDPDDIVLTNPGTFRRSLPPGRTLRFRLQGESPVSAWIANVQNSTVLEAVANPGATVLGEVAVEDGDDNGIRDSWSVMLTGCPLEPVPEEAESWQIPRIEHGRVPIDARVGLRRRTYWRSKERGLELPTPEV